MGWLRLWFLGIALSAFRKGNMVMFRCKAVQSACGGLAPQADHLMLDATAENDKLCTTQFFCLFIWIYLRILSAEMAACAGVGLATFGWYPEHFMQFCSGTAKLHKIWKINYNSLANSPNLSTRSALTLLNRRCSKSRYFFLRSIFSTVSSSARFNSSRLDMFCLIAK